MNAEQLSLDAPAGLVRRTDPGTSAQAAQRITGRTERLLVEWMTHAQANPRYAYDWTADELCEHLPLIHPPTLVSALSRLHKARLIEPTGATRPSRRGSAQQVYRLSTERVEF